MENLAKELEKEAGPKLYLAAFAITVSVYLRRLAEGIEEIFENIPEILSEEV